MFKRKKKNFNTYFSMKNELSEYDIFVSYRTYDSSLVRGVCETLISMGLKVWFAEYNIALHEQSEFKELIDIGLEKSKIAVLFTRKEWVESEHCQHEISKILNNKVISRDNIIQIEMSNDPEIYIKYPILKEVKTYKFQDNLNNGNSALDVVNSVVNFITTQIKDVNYSGNVYNTIFASNIFTSRELNFKIGLDGWTILDKGGYSLPSFDIAGPTFSRIVDNHEIKGNLLIGLAQTDRGRKSPTVTRIDYDAFKRTIGHAIDYKPPNNMGLSDKDAFKNGYMYFLDRFENFSRHKVIGIHLFYFYNYANFAVTYWRKGMWVRKFSLVLPDPKTGYSYEFIFTFHFAGNFYQFCKYTYLMEIVVQSIHDY